MNAEVDKLDIAKLVNGPISLNNWKRKRDDLDAGKLKTLPVDLKKLNDVVDKEIVKNTKPNRQKTKVNRFDKKIPELTTSISMNQYQTEKQNLEKKNRRCW